MRIVLFVAVAGVIVVAALSIFGSGLQRSGYAYDSPAPVIEKVMVRPEGLGVAMPEGRQLPASPFAVKAPPSAQPRSAPNGVQIARTGSLSLYVANLDDAVRVIERLAQRDGGDILSLQSGSEDSSATVTGAHMQIRVDASHFDEAMNDAGTAGRVRSRTINAEDLTANIVDSGARLRNLQQTEADIRAIMNRSGSIAQVLDAENQLSQVRERIETLESDLKSMRGRVAYATIDVALALETPPAPTTVGAAAQLGAAWADALAAVKVTVIGIAAIALWVLAFIPLAALCGLFAWTVYALLRRFHASRATA